MGLRFGILATAVALFGLPGCGGGGPKLVPVSGNVTLNGKPFKDAEIVFVPDGSGPGLPGLDKTGPEGNYIAMTQGRRGLAPGKYKVHIKRTLIDPNKIPPEFKNDPYMAQYMLEPLITASGQGPARKANTQPTEISQEFEREVSPEGGVLDFDVKAEVPKS